MSVFKTAYDTTQCRGQVLTKIVSALQRAVRDWGVSMEDGVYPVKRSNLIDEGVPVFYHPVVLDDEKVFIDVRSFGKIDLRSYEFVVTNQDGYDAAMLRARMQAVWSDGNYGSVRSLKLPAMVFPAWVGENVTRHLNLGPGEQQIITVLASIFYFSLFNEDNQLSSGEETAILAQVAKATRFKNDVVKEFVDKYPVIRDVSEFCEVVKEELQSTRGNNLNPGTLYTIMSGTWYGANSAELVAVALEHPPTWVYIVYQAATSRSYHHSKIAKMIMDRSVYKEEIRNFTISLNAE